MKLRSTAWMIAVCAGCFLCCSAAYSESRSLGVSAALGAIFNDDHIEESALHVHQQAEDLPAEERFEFLSRWVLPGSHHETFRLQAAFTPTHPSVSGKALAAGVAQSVGGELVSPALDLVDVAAELNKLPELQQRIETASTSNALMAKNRAAIAALVLLKVGRVEQALAQIDQVRLLSVEEQPDDQRHRSAEVILLHSGRRLPAMLETLQGPIEAILKRQRSNFHWTIWGRQLRAVLASAQEQDSLTATPNRQWSSVSDVTAETRGGGMPPAEWQFAPGMADHVVSHGDDSIYFAAPLRGDYEVECDCTGLTWNGVELQIGGIWVRLNYTHAGFDVGNMRNSFKRNPLSTPFTKTTAGLHYRTVVRQNVAKAFINGRELHAQPLSDGSDPWVVLRSDYRNIGSVFNVRITGQPEIPEQLHLTASELLDGWMPYFGGTVGWSDSHWRGLYRARQLSAEDDPALVPRGGILATIRDDVLPGSHFEEALFYHRPMQEDGTIEYEFFYREGEITAHPAIDRLCLLIQPSGIKTHWLTDGPFERTSLSPDNETVEAENRRGTEQLPLRPDTWNRVQLTLKGDVIDLHLNGQLICQRPLESNNQRRFGFFHYADREEVRVRNVTWRGDWPCQLPSIADQDLAEEKGDFLDQNIDHLTASFTHDFSKDGLSNELLRVIDCRLGVDVLEVPGGVQGTRSSLSGYRNAKLATQFEVHGDFDIVATYDQFESNPSESGSSSVYLTANLANETKDHVFVMRRHIVRANGTPEQVVQCAIVQQRPEGEQRQHFLTQPAEERSGRLRLSRRGNMAYYLTAENDSPNFRLWATREFKTDPIALDGIVLMAQIHQKGSTSVIWKNISIKAEKLSGAAVEGSTTDK